MYNLAVSITLQLLYHCFQWCNMVSHGAVRGRLLQGGGGQQVTSRCVQSLLTEDTSSQYCHAAICLAHNLTLHQVDTGGFLTDCSTVNLNHIKYEIRYLD